MELLTATAVFIGDCEARVGRFWEQGVNSWSSLSYVVAAALLTWAVARGRLPMAALVLAAAMALEGFGSVLFHGTPGDVSHAIHDVALFAIFGHLVGWHLGRFRNETDLWSVAGAGIGLVVGSSIWLIERGSTNAIVMASVAAMIVADLVARRRGLTAVGNLSLVGLAAVAGASWWLGRSESPFCDPDSPLQFHSVWHVLSAIMILAWADRAYTVEGTGRPLRMFRRSIDRCLGGVAWLLVHAFHRSVEAIGTHRIPSRRPVLLVANHGNGFVDPVIVAAVLGRVPRFMAKAALWNVVPARPLLALVGVLPVHRTADGDDATSNARTFAAAWNELAHASTVAIFPEGTTGDRAGIDRVRTGAARLALGALADAPDLVVLPIGLAFESRIETRSRAVVIVGEPITVEDWFARWRDAVPARDGLDPTELPPEAVVALTDEIRHALEAVSPEFDTVDERELLRAAARVATVDRARQSVAPFGDVERLARRLAASPATARAAVFDAYRTYATRLQLLRLHDDDVLPRRSSRLRFASALAALFFFGSIVVTATIVHLPALVIVLVATGMVRSTATKGTVRLLVGTAAGLATWIIAGLWVADGVGALIAGATMALGGAVALGTWSVLVRALAQVRGHLRARDRAGLVPTALEDRAQLLAEIERALATTPVPDEREIGGPAAVHA
ncbi:hypothetical protein BH23ACT3_BH23ACT3_05030 [soil metagenome]